jgi:DNA-binding MarR family transcriptional regulator
MQELIKGAKAISLFCRININTKKELPIRSGEMGLLIYLVKENPQAQPIQVADFFNVSKPMVTSMINSLENKEFIIKNPSLNDKRSFFVSPTEKAVLLVESTYSEYYKTMEALQKGLGDEDYNQLICLIDKANKTMLEAKIK